MPSFDVVSEINKHELNNAIDQTNREVSTRFDFKGTGSRVELSGKVEPISSIRAAATAAFARQGKKRGTLFGCSK